MKVCRRTDFLEPANPAVYVPETTGKSGGKVIPELVASTPGILSEKAFQSIDCFVSKGMWFRECDGEKELVPQVEWIPELPGAVRTAARIFLSQGENGKVSIAGEFRG